MNKKQKKIEAQMQKLQEILGESEAEIHSRFFEELCINDPDRVLKLLSQMQKIIGVYAEDL